MGVFAGNCIIMQFLAAKIMQFRLTMTEGLRAAAETAARPELQIGGYPPVSPLFAIHAGKSL